MINGKCDENGNWDLFITGSIIGLALGWQYYVSSSVACYSIHENLLSEFKT